ADKHVRKLPTKTQFLALLYGQISAAAGPRAPLGRLPRPPPPPPPPCARPGERPPPPPAHAPPPRAGVLRVFVAAGGPRAGRLRAGVAGEIKDCVLLPDPSPCPLNRRSEDWARFSAGVCGVKMHVVYDPDADCPIYAAITPQRVNDITVAQAMPIQPGATY